MARAAGRQVYAKLQIGVTHEIATVPYYPLLPNIAEKLLRLVRAGGSGAMECWNFGNFLSRNTEVANWFSWEPLPESPGQLLRQIAARDFGAAAADSFVAAWGRFCEAAEFFPFDNKFVYDGPMHIGGAYPLFAEKTGKPMAMSWLLPGEVKYNAYDEFMGRGEFGDDLGFLSKFGPEMTVRCLRKLLAVWAGGLRLIEQAMPSVPESLRSNAAGELAVASAVRLAVRHGGQLYRVHLEA